MALLSREFLDNLRSSCPIEVVMGRYTNLKRVGRNFVCSCPFHSEKTPSCYIYPDQQSFYCFGCGAGGDVITFLNRIENLTFQEAVERLAQMSGISIPKSAEEEAASRIRARTYEINREAANFFYKNLTGTNKVGLAYFAKRNLSPATIKKYALGYAPDEWNGLSRHLRSKGFTEDELVTAGVCHRSQKGGIYDVFRNRVMFPIVDTRGSVIGFGGRVMDDSTPKYLNSSQTPVFDKGRNLFSLNFAKDSSSNIMILAEGYMDVIAINQAGFQNVVATLGTAITAEQARLIARYAKEVIIAYDSDTAGQKATRKAIAHFNDVGVNTRILHIENAKDPDEYIRKFGADRFRLLLDKSGDAIAFQMEYCKEGLNLSVDSDKAKWLNRLVDVLADVPNKLTRDVYISKAAEETKISPDTLREQIERKQRINRANEKKGNWDRIMKQTVPQQNTIVGGSPSVYLERAEEDIAGYILKYPEALPKTVSKLQNVMENTTFFFRKLIDCMQELEKNGSSCSLTALRQLLSNEEAALLSKVLSRHQSVPPTEESVDECINKLRCKVNVTPESNDDLLLLINQKKKKQS